MRIPSLPSSARSAIRTIRHLRPLTAACAAPAFRQRGIQNSGNHPYTRNAGLLKLQPEPAGVTGRCHDNGAGPRVDPGEAAVRLPLSRSAIAPGPLPGTGGVSGER
jgi:hypothetical protein